MPMELIKWIIFSIQNLNKIWNIFNFSCFILIIVLSYFKSYWGPSLGWEQLSYYMLHQITSQSYATHLKQWQTCSPSLSPSFSPSCLLISTLSSGPEDLIQLRNTGAETPHDNSRIWFWHHINDTWLSKHSELYMWWKVNIQYSGGQVNSMYIIIKQLARHEPHEDRDEWRSLMTAEESSSWSYWRPEWQVESLGFPTLPARLHKPRSYYKIIPYWS